MIFPTAGPQHTRLLSGWLDDLQDPGSSALVEHAAHDQLDGRWQHDGARFPGHVNWLVLSGEMLGEIAGQPLRILPGGWLCIAPMTRLYFRPGQGRQRIRLLRFRLHLARAGTDLPMPGGGFLLPSASGLHATVSRLIRDVSAVEPFAERRRRGLLMSLYGEAFRRLCEPVARGAHALEEVDMVQLENYVAAVLPGRLSAADLAQRLHMKPDTFARAFKRTCGESPRRWLSARRIIHAAELLLRRDATATQVADLCGYADVFHFCRKFQQVMGCGTLAWRRRHGVL